MFPHINRSDIDIEAEGRITMVMTMKNSEGESKERKIQTRLVPIRLKVEQTETGSSKIFKMNGKQFTINTVGERGTETWLRDVMNHEEEMNREDYHEGKSWDYWFIYSIKRYKLEIRFPYNPNKPTHQAQVIHGAI